MTSYQFDALARGCEVLGVIRALPHITGCYHERCMIRVLKTLEDRAVAMEDYEAAALIRDVRDKMIDCPYDTEPHEDTDTLRNVHR